MNELQQLLNAGEDAALLQALTPRLEASSGDGQLRLFKGVALFRQGDLAASEQAFEEALAIGLDTARQAWKNLGNVCYSAGKYAEAAEFIGEYRESAPHERDSLILHCSALVSLGKYKEAEPILAKFLEIFPDDPEMQGMFMYLLGLQGRFVEVLAYSGKLSEAGWRHAKVLQSVCGAFSAMGLRDAAHEALMAPAIAAGDVFPPERAALETALFEAERAYDAARFAEAIAHYQRLLAMPGLDETEISVNLFNLSLAFLADGQLEAGWRLMRAREAAFPQRGMTLDGVPRWDGEPLAGKRLVIHAEQGLGDVIHFVRYVPQLAQAGVQVVFNAYPEILKLLGNDPAAQAMPCEAPKLAEMSFDFQARLLDLPAMLGVNRAADIRTQPYLFASPAHLAQWRARLHALPGVKIGLVWAGNPEYKNDHNRSASLRDFAALAAVPGVTWVLLQKGAGEEEGRAPPEGMAALRLSDEIGDFDDTAAIVHNLDLVISVDTAVAHLAGAMGKPVWILLPEAGKDWRWFLDEARTPWYPTARLLTRGRMQSWRDFMQVCVLPALLAWRLETLAAGSAARDVAQALLKPQPGDAPGLWARAVSEMGMALLPAARMRMLEARDDSPLRALEARFPEEAAVVSARAEWLLEYGAGTSEGADKEKSMAKEADVRAALERWQALADSGAAIPPSGYIAWGRRLHAESRFEAARAVWDRALSTCPDSAYLHYLAGLTEQQAGVEEAARLLYREALAIDPRLAEAHNNLAILGRARGQENLQACQSALRIDGQFSKAWKNTAHLLLEQNAARAALVIARARCALEGEQIFLSRALLGAGERAEARAVADRLETKALDGKNRDVCLDLAFIYRELGEVERARRLFERMFEVYPDAREGRFPYGWLLLSLGECQEGWRHYAQGLSRKKTVMPEWRGEPLAGKTLLVFQDQGMGDLFQFVHLVRDIPPCLRLTLAVYDAAVDFIRQQRFPCRVVPMSSIDWASHSHDFQIAQMKLQSLLGADLAHPPRQPPYLRAPRDGLPRWAAVCEADAKLKIGIVWAGNPRYSNDARRSTRLRDWLPLFDLPGVSLYNLQKDAASNQALAWEDLKLHNMAADCDSWTKTASAVMLLDLIISVDSGVAHLASGVGKKVWTLIPNLGVDYRWMLEREDVPWYPQMRLFRQGVDETWADVLLRVRDRLVQEYPEALEGQASV